MKTSGPASTVIAHSLGCVRIRASRAFQVNREVRELLLVLVRAFLGLATLVKTTAILGVVLFGVLLIVVGGVMRSRLRRRLGG